MVLGACRVLRLWARVRRGGGERGAFRTGSRTRKRSDLGVFDLYEERGGVREVQEVKVEVMSRLPRWIQPCEEAVVAFSGM